MRNVCLPAAALVVASTTIASAAREIPVAPVSENPLIAPWTGPYGGVPPWDKLEPGRFAGAFELAMAEERREIEAIVSNPEAPTFENTIAAMERAGGMRERLETFSTRRDLRERVWKKFKSRGDNGDANDSKATAARIVTLRAERAARLGYASHAHWRMADMMALDPKNA
jgi:Zn-dependent oligopeptidase